MRAHEILCEQTHEDLARNALITVITTQHALGIPEIASDKLLKSLEDRNFFMDQDWLFNQVQSIPTVDAEGSKPELIVLKLPAQAPKTAAPATQEPDAAGTVEKMAKKALAQRMK